MRPDQQQRIDRFIRRNWRRMSVEEIASRLGRPKTTIRRRAELLGLVGESTAEDRRAAGILWRGPRNEAEEREAAEYLERITKAIRDGETEIESGE